MRGAEDMENVLAVRRPLALISRKDDDFTGGGQFILLHTEQCDTNIPEGQMK